MRLGGPELQLGVMGWQCRCSVGEETDERSARAEAGVNGVYACLPATHLGTTVTMSADRVCMEALLDCLGRGATQEDREWGLPKECKDEVCHGEGGGSCLSPLNTQSQGEVVGMERKRC